MLMTIPEKITAIQGEIETLDLEYRELMQDKALKEQKFVELQGALKALNELNGDQSTESKPS
tara:strand:- start:176 stop:361 length:186 start_codon:yes stop_codon:yes gene_type:complete